MDHCERAFRPAPSRIPARSQCEQPHTAACVIGRLNSGPRPHKCGALSSFRTMGTPARVSMASMHASMGTSRVRSLATTLAMATLVVLLSTGCKKEVEVIPNNQPPAYDGVPSLLVRNYVNRLYIDLIGREPLDAEMEAEVTYLRAYDLSQDARRALVTRIMTDTTWIDGDSSYAHAYYRRQYEMYKSRFLEGVSDQVIDQFISDAEDAAIADSLAGNTAGAAASMSEVQKLRNVRMIPVQFRRGQVGYSEVHARLVYNGVYDFIHMNSFNFVNATFDNLFFRFPTNTEFNAAYAMVGQNTPAILFGHSGQNKAEYVGILTGSQEFREGTVRWCYQTFMGRLPSTPEVYAGVTLLQQHNDLQRLQREIFVTDEYAGFN